VCTCTFMCVDMNMNESVAVVVRIIERHYSVEEEDDESNS